MKKEMSGFSTLEFAVVLPTVLIFTLGFLSVGRIFQARTTLQEGLRASLRCLKAVDDCAPGKFEPPKKFFHWYEVPKKVVYHPDTYTYSGSASWINRPKYEYSDIKAQVLDGVHASYNQTRTIAQRVSYPVFGEIESYVISAKQPYIMAKRNATTGKVVAAGALDPEFRYLSEPGTDYPVYKEINLSGKTLSAAAGKSDWYSVTFKTPPSPGDADHCFQVRSDLYDRPTDSTEADFLEPCGVDLTQQVPIVFHVTGQSGGKGGVALKLVWTDKDGNSQERKMGSRGFSGNRWGSFVPRGADSKYIDPAIRPQITDPDQEYTELDDYSDYLHELPYNTNVTLKMTLKADASLSAEWTGEKLRIFAPLIKKTKIVRDCQGVSVPKGSISAYQLNIDKNGNAHRAFPNSECLLSDLNPKTSKSKLPTADRAEIDISRNVDTSPAIDLACSLSATEETVHVSGVISDMSNYDLSRSDSCPPYETSHSCGEGIGIADTAGVDGFIRNSTDAMKRCPPLATDRLRQAGNPSPSSVFWNEKIVSITGAKVTWIPETCADNFSREAINEIPPIKIDLGDRLVSKEPYYTGNVDPKELLEKSEYHCDYFSLEEKIFNSNMIPSIPSDSLFSGVRPDLGEKCYADALRKAAKDLGLDERAYFVPTRTKYGVDTVEKMPEKSCEAPYSTELVGNSENILLTTNKPLPEGQKPARCDEPHVICSAVLASIEGGKPPVDSPDKLEIARQRGKKAILAAYPSALFCDEIKSEDCITFEILEKKTEKQLSYVANASSKIPLFFVDPVPVSVTKEEIAEINFAR